MDDHTSRETGQVKNFIKRKEIPLCRHYYNGEDPSEFWIFLFRFTREATIQGISEAQVFVPLASFLDGSVLSKYDAKVRMTP